jgi:hypothetical protein
MLIINKVIKFSNNAKAHKIYDKNRIVRLFIVFSITLLLFNNNNNIEQW